ncbi:MAG: tetratricopeptide repeat protein [Candidatus Zophobacter franzmannii]|nr:tetratricopeptide repeat protein [Candidatus Zophobacter franzmannii]
MKNEAKPVIGAFLVAVLTAIVFLPVLNGQFLNWDDNVLFVENPYFRGLGLEQWQWMCTTFFYGHWQPLSWVSYALDYTVWDMNPNGWHGSSWLLHAFNSALVYLLCLHFLKKPAGRVEMIAAGIASLLYAIHPLRVEAVAWLATRGYLLGTAWCILSCLFYLRAVSKNRYPLGALLFFALAVLTKGIAMMVPPVLLLIDWFPLRRITSTRRAIYCAFEKIPFFLLSMLAGIMAFLSKNMDGGMATVEAYGVPERIGQAIYSVWFYLWKTIFPLTLSPLYYKHPSVWALILVFVLTAGAGVALFLFRRPLRLVIVAAGASLLLIFPMLGITQSGAQLFADRFIYLAAIPFAVLTAVFLAGLTGFRRIILGVLAALLVLFGIQSAVWSVSWQDSLTLWSSAVAVDEDNSRAHNSAGLAFKQQARYEKALEHFNAAIRINPGYIQAWHNRSVVLALTGRYDEAFSGWRIAFSLPEFSQRDRMRMLWVRGWVFEKTGELEAAEQDYSAVVDGTANDLVLRAGVLQLRAELYLRMEQNENALKDLQAILKLPDPFGTRRSQAKELIKTINFPSE